ncbi:MAG TPA: LD-carboxypeptidase [Steroidobacteraceae bacterium]|nr:LD-carboxypeptidase [Steroidobacteraceae bacterium]
MRARRAVTGQRALLERGDIVDVIAPGFRCSEQSLQRGLEFLRALGLVPRVPPRLFAADLLCANTDERRLEQLARALRARDSRCVWCVRAGYGAIRLVPGLLRLARPARPKLFVGYSDATTIHYLLNQHWHWPSLHGPLLDRLGAATLPAASLAELKGVLLAGVPRVSFDGLTALNAAARRTQVIRSRLFGGNLTVLQSLLGTALQRRPRQILFLEDIGERAYRIDRMLQHLRQAGVLSTLKAVVFGTFTGGEEPDRRNLIRQVLERFAREQSFPVLLGLAAGHGEEQRPLFFNTAVELHGGSAPRLLVTAARL